jgi:hypothetical protein
LFIAIRAFVFAGLPTTRTFTSSAALALMASPWGLKMAPFASRRSARSMPCWRGLAPMSRATLVPSKASFASAVMSTESSRGKAQSWSSIAVPSAALSAGSISSSFSWIFSSGPSSWPEAIRNRIAYPIAPAAPVTVTVLAMESSPISRLLLKEPSHE